MPDSFVRFIVLCRTLQEWHTARWAIEEDEKCGYHGSVLFCTPTSVEVVATPTARLSCTRHVDSPKKKLSFVWAAETSCDDKTRRARKANKKKKRTKLVERRGVRSNLRTYVSYAPAKRSFIYFRQEKNLKGSPVVASVATAKVEGRRRSCCDGQGGMSFGPLWRDRRAVRVFAFTSCDSKNYDCLQPPVRKFSHSCCVDSQTSVTRQASRQLKNRCWRRSTWTRAKCGRGPLWSRCAWLSWTAFPTKNSSLSIISYEKASQVFEEKELDKHRLLAQWGVVRLVVVVRGVESTTGSAWMMGVQVHTGTRVVCSICKTRYFLDRGV